MHGYRHPSAGSQYTFDMSDSPGDESLDGIQPGWLHMQNHQLQYQTYNQTRTGMLYMIAAKTHPYCRGLIVSRRSSPVPWPMAKRKRRNSSFSSCATSLGLKFLFGIFKPSVLTSERVLEQLTTRLCLINRFSLVRHIWHASRPTYLTGRVPA